MPISYMIEGKGDQILFLHGWGQSKELMIPLIDELKNKYSCILVDLPGFGDSAFNNAKNICEYTKKFHNFLISKKLAPKYIVGHSFGGKVAVEYLNKYNGVEKLVLIASPVLKQKKSVKVRLKIVRYKINKFLCRNKKSDGSEDYKNCPKGMKNFFVSVVNTNYDKDIKDIKIPVLIIWGNKDKKVSVKDAYKLNKIIENSVLHIQEGDHFSYLENIDLTKLAIQKFLRSK